jgi:hypothetical protein
MATESNDTELLREAWAALDTAVGELVQFHKENMFVIPGQPGHDEWERCECKVAGTIRDTKLVERKLFAELEGRGAFV